jgi:hypothetical protein
MMELVMSNTAKPKPIRIPVDVEHALISNRVLWEEAARFQDFILENQLQHCMQTSSGDARWAIFFVLIVRYITAHPELGKLVDSSDIPF